MIDRGYRDLSKVNLEQEMCNSQYLGSLKGNYQRIYNLSGIVRYIKKKSKLPRNFQDYLNF